MRGSANQAAADPSDINALVSDLITKELAALNETKTSGEQAVNKTSENTGGSADSSSAQTSVEDVDMDTVFKVPTKRKILDTGNASKVKKPGEDGADPGSDSESVCSDASDGSLGDICTLGEGSHVQYDVVDIKRFLHNTKGQRCVEVEHFFPDRVQFINDVCCLMRENAFTGKETARLRKFLTRLRKKVREESSPSLPT